MRPLDPGGVTVTVMAASPTAPWLSVTRRWMAMAVLLVTDGAVKLTSRAVADGPKLTGGPLVCDHSNVIGSPLGSDDPAALSATCAPDATVWSRPAFASGGRLAGTAPTPKSSVQLSSVPISILAVSETNSCHAPAVARPAPTASGTNTVSC